MRKNIISLFLIAQIFAIGGLGLYGGANYHSTPTSSTTNGDISLSTGPMNNSGIFGLFLYLDVLPVIDLEASFEAAGATYPFTFTDTDGNIGSTANEIPWARRSAYFTVRKKITGIGIPFLAKAQLYGGLGVNTHTITPNLTLEFIDNAFEEPLESSVLKGFSTGSTDLKSLMDYMDKRKDSKSGFHIQVGAQAKLLFISLFINARYTLAKDVVNGTSGFPTVWTGLAVGL